MPGVFPVVVFVRKNEDGTTKELECYESRPQRTRVRMPLPQIAIEIAGPSRAAPKKDAASGAATIERDVLLEACAAAAENAVCVVAGSQKNAEILALVFWRGPSSVRVEVSSLSRAAPWATRELQFGAADPQIERWRTAGYTVGLLAAEALTGRAGRTASENASAEARLPASAEPREASPGEIPARATTGATTDGATDKPRAAPASPPEATKPVSPPVSAPTATAGTAVTNVDRDHEAPVGGAPSYRWWLAAGGVLGGGLDSVRGGGFLRAGRAFAGSFATAALAYSASPRDSLGLSAEWVTLSAGVGHEFTTPWFAVALRGELAAELLATRIEQPVSGRTDSKSRWVPALCAGAELVRELAGPVRVFVGLEANVRSRRTDVQIGDTVRTTAPLADVVGLAGARLMLR